MMLVAVRPKCAVRLFEFGRVPCHNFPLTVFPYPDSCPSPCCSERFAVFVFARDIIIPICNRKVLAVHAYIEGGIGRTCVGVGIILVKSEIGFFVPHRAVCTDIGKVVRPETCKVGRIFGEYGCTPRFGDSRDLFRNLFGFFSRHHRLRRTRGNTSRQSCADSNEYNQ